MRPPCALCPEPRLPGRSRCRPHHNAYAREMYRRRVGATHPSGSGPCIYPGCGSMNFRYYQQDGRRTRRCVDCANRQRREWRHRKRLEAAGMTPVEAAWAVSAGAA